MGNFHLATKKSDGSSIGEHDNHTIVAEHATHNTHDTESFACTGEPTKVGARKSSSDATPERSQYGADAYVYSISEDGQHDGTLALAMNVHPYGEPCENWRPWGYTSALAAYSDNAHMLAAVVWRGNLCVPRLRRVCAPSSRPPPHVAPSRRPSQVRPDVRRVDPQLVEHPNRIRG